MHRFANLVVAAKTEGNIRYAAAHLRMRQVRFDPTRCVDVIDGIVVVLFHAGRNRKYVRIEDDVFGGKSNFVYKNSVGALANADLVFIGGGLTLFVKGHHNDGRAVLQYGRSVLAELFFAFFERNRIDDAFALEALQPGLNHLPFRGVQHEGDFRDFGLAREQLQEARHRRDAIDHAFVHADVDDVRAVFYLLAGNTNRFFELPFLHQFGKLRRAGDVRAFADHDVDASLLCERL